MRIIYINDGSIDKHKGSSKISTSDPGVKVMSSTELRTAWPSRRFFNFAREIFHYIDVTFRIL